MDMPNYLERCRASAAKTVAIRRSLHRRPEVGLDLPETAAIVAAELDRLGIAYRKVGSGLLADIGTRGPRIGMRADMDALPVEEKTGADYSSEIPGRMHACGHDAHMAALLGAAAVLAEDAARGELPFRARLLFQTGEEGFFGARPLIAAGALEGLSAIEGGHVGDLSDELAPGQAGFLPGPLMAASDSFEGIFIGSGGHGSAPHRSPDPIAAFAGFIAAINNFRSRELDQRKPAVVSVCAVHAGMADNVIPERLEFKGTARSLEAELRALLERRIGELGEATARLWNLRFEYNWIAGYPPLTNDAASSNAMEAAARELLGSDRVLRLASPVMGGEDFAYYLESVPGAFWFLNTQSPATGIVFPNHNPRFNVDEGFLADAAALHLSSAAALAAGL
jgi:amidohydrolase